MIYELHDHQALVRDCCDEIRANNTYCADGNGPAYAVADLMDKAFNSDPGNLPQGYLDYVTPKNIEDKLRERDNLSDDEKDDIDLIADEAYESFKKGLFD